MNPASGLVLPHHGCHPQIDGALYIAPNASIIGEVTAGPDCSFWFSTVVRGDVNAIRIGRGTNVQDLTMIHVSYNKAATVIGEDVTIGHQCVLHGCTVGNRVLVGMGSLIMDNVVIEDDCLIGAGTLLTEGTRIPRGSLIMGRPGAVKRPLRDEEIAYLARSAEHYRKLARSYHGGPWPYSQTGI
jgi:carbonic anhydrase/acetyltransferase-like protein (isoleucine patch superfamily)